MKFINGTTFLELGNLVRYCEQPNLNILQTDLVTDISEGLKYISMVTQRNFLEHLRKSDAITHEIRELAKKKYQAKERVRHEELDILRVRLKIKEREIIKQKNHWTKISTKTEKRLDYEGRNWFRNIKRTELTRYWSKETNH